MPLKERNIFIMSAFSEDVIWWLPSFFFLYFYDFFPNRNEDRKTALLNLLSVKGLLGIFSMWRKIRKSPQNFCQAAEVRDSSHTPLGLVNSYQGFRGGSSSLTTSEREASRAGKRKLTWKAQGSYQMSTLLCLTIEEA